MTDLVITVTSLHFAYRSVPLHAMLETTATVIAFLTTILLGASAATRRLDDLLFFAALAVLTLTSFSVRGDPGGRLDRPASVLDLDDHMRGRRRSGVLAAAAVVPSIPLRDHMRATRILVTAMGVSLLAMVVVIGFLVKRLPIGIDPSRNPVKLPGLLAGNGFIVGAQMVIAVLYVVAAVGFTRRAGRSGDELLLWLGAGSVVAAFARRKPAHANSPNGSRHTHTGAWPTQCCGESRRPLIRRPRSQRISARELAGTGSRHSAPATTVAP